MNKKEVDSHRYIVQSRLEELTIISASQGSDIKQLTIISASQGSDIKHIFKNIVMINKNFDEVKTLMKEHNGRLRKQEGGMAAFKAIGITVGLLFSSFFGYFFMKG